MIVIGGFLSVLCVSVFPGSLLVIVIMIDGSETAIVKAAFELKSSHVCEKHSNEYFIIRKLKLFTSHCHHWYQMMNLHF